MNDSKYVPQELVQYITRSAWVDQEIERGTFYFYKELDMEDHCVCDCMKSYGRFYEKD